MLALAGLELEALQVVDVAVGDEEAADAPLRVAVRVVVDADPDRRPARRDELALEAGPLAGERGVDVRVVELVDVAARATSMTSRPEDLVGALAQPVEERLVDEAVALVAVDVGERQPERVQLALRQREQRRPALDGLADRSAGAGSSRRLSERVRAMAIRKR